MASAYAKAPAGGPDDDGKCKACGGSGKSKKPSKPSNKDIPTKLGKGSDYYGESKYAKIPKDEGKKVKPSPKDIDKKKDQFKKLNEKRNGKLAEWNPKKEKNNTFIRRKKDK